MYEIVKIFEVIEEEHWPLGWEPVVKWSRPPEPKSMGFFLDKNEAENCVKKIEPGGDYKTRHIEFHDGIRIKETGEIFLLANPNPLQPISG